MLNAAIKGRLLATIDRFQECILRCYKRNESWAEAQELIQNVAQALLEETGNTHKRVDLRKIIDLLGVTVVWGQKGRRGNSSYRAYIIPIDEGFEIRLGHVQRHQRTRTRFSVAHECGHVLFYLLGSRPPRRLIPASSSGGSFRREEGLCDAFAGALLVPRLVLTEIVSQPPELRLLIDRASQLEVSGEVLVRQVLHDRGAWPDSVIYRIDTLVGQDVRVSCFRGAKAKRRRTGCPSALSLKGELRKVPKDEWREPLAELVAVQEVVETPGGSLWVRA